MYELLSLLVLAALVVVIMHCMNRAPLWLAVFLLAVVDALLVWPHTWPLK